MEDIIVRGVEELSLEGYYDWFEKIKEGLGDEFLINIIYTRKEQPKPRPKDSLKTLADVWEKEEKKHKYKCFDRFRDNSSGDVIKIQNILIGVGLYDTNQGEYISDQILDAFYTKID